MPTIEIVSIDCLAIPDLPSYRSFAYRAETILESHRALFQPVFDTLNGIIIHLADKDLDGEEGYWFAGGIMDWMKTIEDKERELTSTAKSIVRVVSAAKVEYAAKSLSPSSSNFMTNAPYGITNCISYGKTTGESEIPSQRATAGWLGIATSTLKVSRVSRRKRRQIIHAGGKHA